MKPRDHGGHPGSLDAQIAAAEARVQARRQALGEHTASLRRAVKQRLLLPGALLAALGLGTGGWMRFKRKRAARGNAPEAAAPAAGGRATQAWRAAGRGLQMLAAAQVLQPLIRAALDGAKTPRLRRRGAAATAAPPPDAPARVRKRAVAPTPESPPGEPPAPRVR